MKPNQIRKVLIPIDFSPVSLNALETAIAICKRQLATLTVIHIVENAYGLFLPAVSGSGVILGDLVKDANENLADLTRKIRLQHDIVVNHIVQSGNPANEICLWAVNKEVDLIVMGTHGAAGLHEFFIGSNAYRVVKNASCPVMTIPGNNQWLEFKKVLFPVRAVPNARDKYLSARPIIKKNASSLLIAGIVKKTDMQEWKEIQELVSSIQDDIVQDGVICGSQIHPCENVAKQVLAISDAEKPDLIVITATLDSSLRDFFLGPYTQDIVNHAKFPVLSIKPPMSPKVIKVTSRVVDQLQPH